MSKKDWIIIVGVLVLPIALDQVFKTVVAMALEGGKQVMLGPIGFIVHQNPIVFMEQFNIIQYISAISPFGFSVFFFFLFFVLNMILVQRLMGLRIGVALFVAGMAGESMDIIFREGVLNWIYLLNIHFNLSDVYIFTGVILTLFFCFKDYSLIFQKNNLRSKMLIEKDQYKFCWQVLLPYLLLICAYFVFSISFIKIVINRFVSDGAVLQSNIVTIFLILFCILSLCFLFIALTWTVYLSNKIYGPVYAFKKYIKDVLLNGEKDRPFKLRKGDFFTDLPDLSQKLKDKYKDKK